MKTIICLIGKSASGKDTVANELTKRYGLKKLKSYATRSPRYRGEDTHIFIDHKKYIEFLQKKDEIVAHTYFDNHHYFATRKQLRENDIYIVDPDGLYELHNNIYNDTWLIPIEIECSENTRRERMMQRGSSKAEVDARIQHDRMKFNDGWIGEKTLLTFSSEKMEAEEIADQINGLISVVAYLEEWRNYA